MRKDLESRNIQTQADEKIINSIFFIRNQKVMIDRNLAKLYGVETRALNQAVRRNMKRFPADFMFQLTQKELNNWISQIVISNKEKMGLRKPPQAFAHLYSLLHFPHAANIPLVRILSD